MSTPVLDEFLQSISSFLRARDERQLQLFLRVEPPLPDHFTQLAQELKSRYRDATKLEAQIDKLIPDNEDEGPEQGGPWPGFMAFLKAFLEYWRDVNFEDLVGTYSQLSGVLNACITAFSHSLHGLMLLPTTIQLAGTLARLATMLDKRPDLTSGLGKVANVDAGESKKSLVETTAEIIQRAFTICLTERGPSQSGIGPDGKPEGKKVGIYSFANLVLKLLFQCRKTQLASQLFTNISQQSPQLAKYPASQRVTFLFYLGRFQLYNTHYYSAQLALQSAYDQCHARCVNQRRHILTYLTTANMILGKFPGPGLYSRPEAAGVLERFFPICKAMRKGDIVAFRKAMSLESGNYRWLFRRNIYLPIMSRCLIIVWRSLARRVFLLTYQIPTDPNSRKAPTLDLLDLLAAAEYCQKILEGWTRPVDPMTHMQGGRTHPNTMFMSAPELVPPPNGPKKLGAFDGVQYRNKKPDMPFIEATVAALVQQGLLYGFISHNQGKFAIIGAKTRGGAFNAGFPPVWEVVKARAEREGRAHDVPGWIQEDRAIGGGGRVVRMTHANPVGM